MTSLRQSQSSHASFEAVLALGLTAAGLRLRLSEELAAGCSYAFHTQQERSSGELPLMS